MLGRAKCRNRKPCNAWMILSHFSYITNTLLLYIFSQVRKIENVFFESLFFHDLFLIIKTKKIVKWCTNFHFWSSIKDISIPNLPSSISNMLTTLLSITSPSTLLLTLCYPISSKLFITIRIIQLLARVVLIKKLTASLKSLVVIFDLPNLLQQKITFKHLYHGIIQHTGLEKIMKIST